MTVSGVVLILGVLALHLTGVWFVYQDAKTRPERAAGFDAALVFFVPVLGMLMYVRHRERTRANPPPATPSHATTAPSPGSQDLIPKLTEELRQARDEAARWRAVAEARERELHDREP